MTGLYYTKNHPHTGLTKCACIRWISGSDFVFGNVEPGLHNITVKRKNTEGGSPGELVYVTYETFEVVILPVLHRS